MPESTTRECSLEEYIMSHLDEAIEREYIKVYYQPVIRTVSRQLCGMEALARWEDPVWGLLPPESFVSVLEKRRRIHDLDAFIIRKVCARYRDAMLNRGVLVPVSINLSRLDYELCDIFNVVETAVTSYKVPRKSLCIEITESALNDRDAIMRQSIEQFRGAGYQVWMDDFGSGYSSLNVLKDYHFDELKVDMWFLSDFHPRSKQILSSIVHMAKEIDIQTLVEGVETEEQFQFLRNIGCEKVQGYLFGQPRPYPDCIRQVLERGVSVEAPVHRKYYDDLGRLNVLSATPFLSAVDRKNLSSGREMNSIPLAVLELRGDDVFLLFTNDAFDETASGVDWNMVFGVPEKRLFQHDPLSLRQFSGHMIRLLEEARVSGVGKMYFVDKDEYYEMRAKRIAEYREMSSILLSMTNLSRGAELTRQESLDEGVRQIYSIYDRVGMIDLNQYSYMPLYADDREEMDSSIKNPAEILRNYARDRIFPEDRQRFLRFADLDTLEERIMKSGRSWISAFLRSRLYHGNYIWKLHTLLKIRDGVYFILVRDAEEEIRDFQSYYGGDDSENQDENQALAPAMLWRNLIRGSSIKFFWKDRDRRFHGASQSFLDFYGFHSLDDILGKTDEDMGWHVHPDLYRGDEWQVIHDGAVTRDILGSCIVRGENRNIIASKMPIYDSQGHIAGLLGYFSELKEKTGIQSDEDFRARLDALTGLLNARGIDEAVFAYRDEFVLRQRDFARINIIIEDFSDINRQYGYDFGDNLIRAVADALLLLCGSTASVGRIYGCHYVVLSQFQEREEPERLCASIRELPARIQEVAGTPFTPYLSVGLSIYSETENTAEQASEAQLRMMSDDGSDSGRNQLHDNMSQVFRMFDNLPIPYAVYKLQVESVNPDNPDVESGNPDHDAGNAGDMVLTEENADAMILYVNRAFARMIGRPKSTLTGNIVSELFPMQGRDWSRIAYRAAILGEEITDDLEYQFMGIRMSVTASQVIGPGYCAFTYQITRSISDKPSEK